MVFGNPHKKSHSVDYNNDDMAEKRVTIWNWREQRKLSGNSAPFKKNLQEYLRKHPDWEEYIGQDKDENGKKSFAPKKRRKDVKPVEGKSDAVRRVTKEAQRAHPQRFASRQGCCMALRQERSSQAETGS